MKAAVNKPRVLVVDDDKAVRESLRRSLEFNGFEVSLAGDGAAALAAIGSADPDLVIMDVMMPRLGGIEATRALRAAGNDVPVLVLTARDAVGDRVEGLDAGAQDYLVKPFEVDELLARLRALLRRTVDEATELDLGGRRLDVTGRRVVGGGQVVDLSGREAALLEVLARRPQQVFTRPQLLAAVFDPADDPGSVDTYVYYLRRKLGRDCVTTVHGVGYRLGTIS